MINTSNKNTCVTFVTSTYPGNSHRWWKVFMNINMKLKYLPLYLTPSASKDLIAFLNLIFSVTLRDYHHCFADKDTEA